MSMRKSFVVGALFISLLLTFSILFLSSGPLSRILAQGGTIDQPQTIQAIVNQLFTNTAQAQQEISFTQTIDTAFNAAVTATAASENTAIALSEPTPTATPFVSPTDIPATNTPAPLPLVNPSPIIAQKIENAQAFNAVVPDTIGPFILVKQNSIANQAGSIFSYRTEDGALYQVVFLITRSSEEAKSLYISQLNKTSDPQPLPLGEEAYYSMVDTTVLAAIRYHNIIISVYRPVSLGTVPAIPITADQIKELATALFQSLPSPPLLSNMTLTDMVTIEGGRFILGTNYNEITLAVIDCVNRDKAKCFITDGLDSVPEHSVTLNWFSLEKYEVSFEQYLAFLNSLTQSYKIACEGEPCVNLNDSDKSSLFTFDGASYILIDERFQNYAATFVTWYGADSYCKAIGRRLPTEAEWERAARSAGPSKGSDDRIYPWGDYWDANNANTNRPTPSKGFTQPVDSYPSGVSADGVYNLAGNAAEWVNDWYGADYYSSRDPSHMINPKGPSSGQEKVVRGGAWNEVPFFARTVQRQAQLPGRAYLDTGFRCAMDASPPQPIDG